MEYIWNLLSKPFFSLNKSSHAIVIDEVNDLYVIANIFTGNAWENHLIVICFASYKRDLCMCWVAIAPLPVRPLNTLKQYLRLHGCTDSWLLMLKAVAHTHIHKNNLFTFLCKQRVFVIGNKNRLYNLCSTVMALSLSDFEKQVKQDRL